MTNIDQLKLDIKASTKELLPALGIKGKRGRFFCPYCQPEPSNHKTPDMTVHGACCTCHKCGKATDIIGIYMDTRGVDFLTAIEALSNGKFRGAVNYAKLVAKTEKPKERKWYATEHEAIDAILYVLQGFTVTKIWYYHMMNGMVEMAVVRCDGKDGKEYRPITKGDLGWYIGRARSKLSIYNLPAITNSFDETVMVTEGEKACDAAIGMGLLGTCCAGGANAVDGSDWEPLQNRRVIVLPDNDEPGQKFALDIKTILPQSIIWNLPGLPPKGDIYDWIQMRGDKTKEQLLAELRQLWKERA